MHKRWLAATIFASMVFAAVCARADDSKIDKPAVPATEPTTDTTKVKRGTLNLNVTAAGAFVPVEPFEVRLRFKAYSGDLLITSAVAAGAAVAKDDVILQFDDTQMKRQLALAESEAAASLANFTKAQCDASLGEASDALALKMQEDEVKNADDGLKWWEKVDGAQMLQEADLQIKYAKDSVGDQQDELDQLKKMYKSEELTNATADIVVKRAIRALENSQTHLKMTEARTEKTKTADFPIAHERVQFGVQQQHQALDALKAQQAQSKVARQSALTAARVGLESANERAAELKEDAAQLTQRAPQSMTIYFGQLVNGSWQNNAPTTLRAGEKLILPPMMPGQVPGAQMTGAVAGKLRFIAEVGEDKIAMVQKGQPMTITPASMPQSRIEATVASIASQVNAGGNYEIAFTIAGDPTAIQAGMKGNIKSAPVHVESVLLVPTTAVSGDKVWIRQSDGADKSVEVSTGRSDGESTEIVAGLKEGDEVLTQAKK